MHLRGIGEDAARAVAQHRVVFPAAFPELVDHLHILLGDGVAVVMRGLPVLPGAARGAVEIAGDDVPSDAALGEMVERRHAARERVGRLERQVAGDAEAEMLVTAAIAGTSINGSFTGTASAWRRAASGLPPNTS